MRLALHHVVAAVALSCCAPEPAGPPRTAEPSGEATPAPLAPGSELLVGEFQYVGEHQGYAIRLGLRFADGQVTRLSQGSPTATEPFQVVADSPGRVVIEVRTEGEPAKRREVVFDGPDVLFDSAAPELRYTRVATLPEGSAADSTPALSE